MTYPYKAWKLQPLFKPVEVEIVGHCHDEYENTATGDCINKACLYPTEADALAAAYAKLIAQQQLPDKRQAKSNKRLDSLKKAENK